MQEQLDETKTPGKRNQAGLKGCWNFKTKN